LDRHDPASPRAQLGHDAVSGCARPRNLIFRPRHTGGFRGSTTASPGAPAFEVAVEAGAMKSLRAVVVATLVAGVLMSTGPAAAQPPLPAPPPPVPALGLPLPPPPALPDPATILPGIQQWIDQVIP